MRTAIGEETGGQVAGRGRNTTLGAVSRYVQRCDVDRERHLGVRLVTVAEGVAESVGGTRPRGRGEKDFE